MVSAAGITINKAQPLVFQPCDDKPIIIVDGDILAFQACPSKSHYSDDKTVRLDENGNRKPVELTRQQELKWLNDSWNNFYKEVTQIGEKLFCETTLIAIGGVRNFREDLFYDYKDNRNRRPEHRNMAVPLIRAKAIEEGLVVNAEGYEADDLIRIWAEQARSAGCEFTICSIDKDLLCIPGRHFLMHKDKEQIIEMDELEAARCYYEQILSGDDTDNIPGVPGIGPVKAKKLLSSCVSEEEMQEVVVETYFAFFGKDDWYMNLLINGKLIHILRHPDDYFDGSDWKIIQELL